MTSASDRAHEWLEDPAYDTATKDQVRQLLHHPDQLTDAFFSDLKFGTGGLRGVMGVGTNRLNIYTIRKTTQGLANTIKKLGNPSRGVVVGFDSRLHSETFAQETAKVLAGNGIPVFLLKELRPTPFISFACRYLKAQAAVMITASHNPKEYNGYKVYWSDGGQVVPPHDREIITQVNLVKSQRDVAMTDSKSPLIQTPGNSLDEAYLNQIKKLQLFPQESRGSLKITYTSLHGTGITLMPAALSLWRFSPPHLVSSQIVPDGRFPTVHFPNPEYREALKIGIDEMVFSESDVLLATDPDADRIGVVVRHGGEPRIMTGNELAAIGAYFICHTRASSNTLPPNGAIVSTIVTTRLLKAIADAYQVAYFDVLTGFKYIGEKIEEWELKSSYHFLFGAEESYGYLIGTHARDKDGIVAGCLFAEICAFLKREGKTMVDYLEEIYQKFGVYRERQLSLDFEEGKKGLDTIHRLMSSVRQTPPTLLAGKKVSRMTDLLQPTPLPKSDVVILSLEDGSEVVIRPSGTEPKLKIYLSTCQRSFRSVPEGITACQEMLDLLSGAFAQFKIGKLFLDEP